MPLIRYRTGDHTRILPPCPCGGVTKRLDQVSRQEDNFSIEALDSILFQIPELVDYRVSFNGELAIDARMLSLGLEAEITHQVKLLYHDIPIFVQILPCQYSDQPMYLGKRYVDNAAGHQL